MYGDDLQIYHDNNSKIIGTSGYVRLAATTGVTYIDGNNVHIRSGDGGETLAKFIDNGAVELYHDDSKKIETTSTGVTITGTAVATAFTGALTGNVTGNASGTSATVTGATQAAITTAANLVTVGALDSGSITSGFGNINIGSSTLTTTGAASLGTITGTSSLALGSTRTAGTISTPNAILYIGADSDSNASGDTIAFQTGGTTRHVMNETQMGIGENTPLGNLHVRSADSGASVDSASDELVVEGSGNSGISILSGTSSAGHILFSDSGDSAAGRIKYEHDNNALNFGTNGSWDDLYIDSSGNVGIGTATPSGSLDVVKLGGDNPMYMDVYSTNQGHVNTLAFRHSKQTHKIGRASCRERV